jgi:hypothetical protein
MLKKRVITYGECPTCGETLREGVRRCQKGHWINWVSGEPQPFNSPSVVDYTKYIGKIHFRGEHQVVMYDNPKGTKDGLLGYLSPNETVDLHGAVPGFYQVKSRGTVPCLGYVAERHVILYDRPDHYTRAKIVRTGGATIWAGVGSTKSVSVVAEGEHIKVYESQTWAKVENGWMNNATLRIMNFGSKDFPKEATVIRDPAATIWKSPGSNTPVKLVKKGESVIVTSFEIWHRVSQHNHWMRDVVLRFDKQRHHHHRGATRGLMSMK